MINPDIRDQAYQFFIEEAPELLQIIESGLLTLRQDRSKPKVHEIMRAAHSLKGGAASVELDTIKCLAHRLEDVFKALYDETIVIDSELESLLLQAYDCLREPLTAKIEVGNFDEAAALAAAEPIWAQLEVRLGDSLTQADQYIPTSADLGVDIVASIFEVDVSQGLERLAEIIAHPQQWDVVAEVQSQVEVFAGFGELLNLPGWSAIASAALSALVGHREQATIIVQLALADFYSGRDCVLSGGDRTLGGTPSAPLLALAESAEASFDAVSTSLVQSAPLFSLDDLFNDPPAITDEFDLSALTLPSIAAWQGDVSPTVLSESEEATWVEAPSLDEVFGKACCSAVPGGIADAPGETAEPDISLPFASDERWDSLETELTAESSPQPLAPMKTSTPSLDEVFGSLDLPADSFNLSQAELTRDQTADSSESLEVLVESVQAIFEQLPSVEEQPSHSLNTPVKPFQSPKKPSSSQRAPKTELQPGAATVASNLSVRVDYHRLERMNNVVGELAINRNSLSLQNDQLQGAVKELLNRFTRFQQMTGQLRELSDQMLIAPERYGVNLTKSEEAPPLKGGVPLTAPSHREAASLLSPEFDSLEMDSYGTLYSLLQTLLEEMIQLEESVDDIGLFAKTSDRTLEQQRQMLTNLRDELMWARMLPLAEVMNRFPRVLRDLSTVHNKPVKLKLTGTGVLIDKAALEKLYDPLLHLLRNAFDHGIEPPEVRQPLGKPEEGQIEIQAYHQGNQTIIEIADDGRGLNLEKIAQQALSLGLFTPEQIAATPRERLQELIFEPGFSTASQVSDLSGRGVGLDVVREQLRSLKGTVAVSSVAGKGTTFTLRLPLTMTIAKLLVCLIHPAVGGSAIALALPSDNIAEIIMPTPSQLKKLGNQRFLYWQQQIIPVYPLSELLEYRCPFPEGLNSKTFSTVPHPEDWGLPLLLLRRGTQFYALEVSRLVTEQELVIKSFGGALAPPSYSYGCTILGDGTLIPVVNGAILIEQFVERTTSTTEASIGVSPVAPLSVAVAQTPTILVVDDSAALRRTLALTLQKSGYRVLQARDGREALEQLQQSPHIELVICDVEMPNMNGFEFLGQRRRDPELMKTPVAMLTSRSSEKHRQLATQLGASAYFTKPYIEQQFLKAINQIIHP